MTSITDISAIEILDSRGNPTLEVRCTLAGGVIGVASVPSGASTGMKEAVELRDKDCSRYNAKGVLNAVANVNNIIAPNLVGCNALLQQEIDKLLLQLDSSASLASLGSNAVLGVSLAVAKAAAIYNRVELYNYLSPATDYVLPVPLLNILNGGAHAQNNIDIQEFMIVPLGFTSFREALRAGCEIYHKLKDILHDSGLATTVGDEGGFAPNLQSLEQAFVYILEAIEQAGYTAGEDIFLALDVAASEFYRNQKYVLSSGDSYNSEQWVSYLEKLVNKYPIISIEDGLAEDDYDGWKLLTKSLGKKVQLVGDDLFVSQEKVLAAGLKKGLANSILIKPNQVGTLTGANETIKLAAKHNYNHIISHRSGETIDTFIADFAVATSAGQIKTGAPCRSERVAKYNRLLQIENILASTAKFAGKSAFNKYLSVVL